MDIFTHMMIGASATAPFWHTHPLESVAFVLGSVLPDIDALSRQFGKVAYLRAHQTWTHAIPLQLVTTALGVAALVAWDLEIFIPSVVVIGAGMTLHSLLDWTNTYGVKLFAPFDRRRRYLEWVFFIDATVIALNIACLSVQVWVYFKEGAASLAVSVVWAALVLAYFAARAALRCRAGHVLPNARSLIPSAWAPWRFYGLSVEGPGATTFSFDAISGDVSDEQQVAIVAPAGLQQLAEFRVMRDLSVGFFATRGEPGKVVCRDLRTRNFGTNFGRLTVDVSGPQPVVEQFDV